jgi:DNA-binding transcriptional LysR family regulator
MNYTLNQLRIFTQVVKSGSISKAAESLDLTQPAVSIQLKNLQRHFDVPLTETIQKKLYITSFGKEIARAAENLIAEAEQISRKTKSLRGELSGQLRISVVSTGKYVIPYFLSSFLSKHQGVELNLDVSNKQGTLLHLRENEIDFALVSTYLPIVGLASWSYAPSSVIIAAPSSSAATATSSVSPCAASTGSECGTSTMTVRGIIFPASGSQLTR